MRFLFTWKILRTLCVFQWIKAIYAVFRFTRGYRIWKRFRKTNKWMEKYPRSSIDWNWTFHKMTFLKKWLRNTKREREKKTHKQISKELTRSCQREYYSFVCWLFDCELCRFYCGCVCIYVKPSACTSTWDFIYEHWLWSAKPTQTPRTHSLTHSLYK